MISTDLTDSSRRLKLDVDAETSYIKYLDAMDTSSREMSSESENRSRRSDGSCGDGILSGSDVASGQTRKIGCGEVDTEDGNSSLLSLGK